MQLGLERRDELRVQLRNKVHILRLNGKIEKLPERHLQLQKLRVFSIFAIEMIPAETK
jgi:hypothetical protein